MKYEKYVLLDNLGSKHSLVMKFDQMMQYCKRKILIKKPYINYDLETSSRPYCVYRELPQPPLENDIFETI